MCLSFVACDSDKKKDDDDDDVKTVKVDKTLCSVCLEKMKGEWFDIGYDANTEDRVLNTFTITDDGKLIIDDKEYKLKFESCSKEYHNNSYAYDAEGNQIYSLSHNFDYEEDVDQQGVNIWQVENGESRRFRSMNKYTIVEITEENWQEYFSADFNDNFDVNYRFSVDKDTWGEITDGDIYQDFVLKDYKKYSYGTKLAIELSYETGDVYCEFDASEEKVTKYNFKKTETEMRTVTQEIKYMENYNYVDNMNITLGYVYLVKEEVLQGNATESWCENPKEILRMKGYLVIKNEA